MSTIHVSGKPGSAESSNPVLDHLPRLLLASLFVVAGAQKLLGFSGVAAWIASEGVPLPELVLIGTILVEIGGGIALGLGFARTPMAWTLAAFTLVATLVFHDFWSASPESASEQLTHFLKNLAIIGGLLLITRLGKKVD